MKYVIFDHCIKNGITDIFHFLLFHGDLYPKKVHHRYGEPADSPLLVAKGGRDWPEIFMPARSLVVSNKVKGALAGVSNVEYCPISFTKLINVKIIKRDFSHFNKSALIDYELSRNGKIIETMADSKALHDLIPNEYSELIVPVVHKMPGITRQMKTASIKIPNMPGKYKDIEFDLAVSDRYPIYWSSAVVIQREVFDMISGCFDGDFFAIAEHEF